MKKYDKSNGLTDVSVEKKITGFIEDRKRRLKEHEKRVKKILESK